MKSILFDIFIYTLVIVASLIMFPYLLITAWQGILKESGVPQEDMDNALSNGRQGYNSTGS